MNIYLRILLAIQVGLLSACTSNQQLFDQAFRGDSAQALAAIERLENRLRNGEAAPGIASAETREAWSQFLLKKYSLEQNSVIRTRIISLCLQGEFDSAPEILRRGARDSEALVRVIAIQGLGEMGVIGQRKRLSEIVSNDIDLFVRIEAAKVMGKIGQANWAGSLIRIILDQSEDQSLRYQAHAAASKLLAVDIPFISDKWRDWLGQKENANKLL